MVRLFNLPLRIFILAVCCLGFSKASFASWPHNKQIDGQTIERNVQVQSKQRQYRVYLPDNGSSYKTNSPLSVVFVFHGGMGSAEQVEKQTGFTDLAKKEGFIVVYPQGTGMVKTWNAGNCCGAAEREKMLDTLFVKAILKDLHSLAKIHSDRIYATGLSNGAMFSFRLACDMPHIFKAVAPVAGRMVYDYCQPSTAVSMAIFNATNDHNVPYKGGIATKGIFAKLGVVKEYPSAQETLSAWQKHNQCSSSPINHTFEGYDLAEYQCASSTSLKQYTLYEGGHSWPGGSKPRMHADTPSQKINATNEIWNFFKSLE